MQYIFKYALYKISLAEIISENLDDISQFFVFINQVYETTSMIISTNKFPSEWANSLDYVTLATALLDRLLYKRQLIQLKEKSYRMQNRKTFFNAKKINCKHPKVCLITKQLKETLQI